MKQSKDARAGISGNGANTSQQPTSSRANTGHTKTPSQSNQVPGTKSSRVGSANRAGSHTNNRAVNQSTSKSRQSGGGSVSGHRSQQPSGHQPPSAPTSKDSSIAMLQQQSAYSQYGLVSGQQLQKTQPGLAIPVGQSQQTVTSTSNLKSAKAVMGNIQMHQKTKSTHLTNSQGFAQLQAAANEGFGIYANGASQTAANSGQQSKLAQKHARHQSNPTWIMAQGATLQQQQTNAKMVNNFDVQPNVSVQIPKSQQITVSEANKSRSKQINQSAAIVGGSQMHPTHQRFNSNKFGTHANSSKIQKSQVNPSGQGENSVTYSMNTTGLATGLANSSAPTKTGGHKKSSSMANSKITQLLLKAGSKHYMHQNMQVAAAMNQGQAAQNRLNQNSLLPPQAIPIQQQLPQKQRIQAVQQTSLDVNGNRQQAPTSTDSQQQFVSSYDIPKRSSDLLPEQARVPSHSGQHVYQNINKSMDMAQQIGVLSSIAQQVHFDGESQADQQLQRILQVESQNESSSQPRKQELSYQDHLSKYLVNKHTKTHQAGALSGQNQQLTQGSHLNNVSCDANMQNLNLRLSKDGASIDSQGRPTSIDVLQPHRNAGHNDSKNNPMLMQQPLLFAQQLNANQQINMGLAPTQQMTGSKVSSNVSGFEKISRQGKIVSSQGVTVKKPSNMHVKNLSVNNKASLVTDNSQVAQQNQQKLGQHVNHQRTKSDHVGSDFTLIINMGKVIQNQKGKVGEILKNNFIDASAVNKQTGAPGSVQHNPGKATNITKGLQKQMRTYTGGERSSNIKNAVTSQDFSAATLPQKQMNGSQISKTASLNSRKPSSSGVPNANSSMNKKVIVAHGKKTDKTIPYKKYEELESKYNMLLEQLETKKSDKPSKYSQIEVQQQSIANNQASLSSLSSKNTSQGAYNRVAQQMSSIDKSTTHGQSMNPRMIRYINNQQKMYKGDSTQVTQNSQKHSKGIDTQSMLQKIAVSSDCIIDTRSADQHQKQQLQKTDMSPITISSPFNDGSSHFAAPCNSSQVSVPVSSTASKQPQIVQSLGPAKRTHHSRINTHYYGQQIQEKRQISDREITLGQSSTAHLTREEIAHHQHMMAIRQTEIQPKPKTSSHGHSHSLGTTSAVLQNKNRSNGQVLQQKHLHQPVNFQARQQVNAQQTSINSSHTPRTHIHSSKERVEQIVALQEKQRVQQLVKGPNGDSQAMGVQGLTRHTRMLYQNLATAGHDNSGQFDASNNKTSMQDSSQEKSSVIDRYNQYPGKSNGASHRRSVSDGNDPNNFNFKQQAINPGLQSLTADRDQREHFLEQNNLQDSGKQTLADHSMQQRKRLEQQSQQIAAAEILKGSTRSQSRSKKNDHDYINMHPADVVSLESSDQHHHPNSQLTFAHISHDRKASSKKGGKSTSKANANGLSKDSYIGKKTPQLKASSKIADGRASSKGAVNGNRHEVQKKTHQRMKSNSYRISNKDNSLLAPYNQNSSANNHNDPSMEGSIQNPSNVVLNGRFIEMTQNSTQGAQQSNVVIKRTGEADYRYDQQYTKEQHLAQSTNPESSHANKRAFHHPALSQPNAWAPMARASQDMFIVQEGTPMSINSTGQFSEDTKPRTSGNGSQYEHKATPIGLSPVLNQKNKPHYNNLMTSSNNQPVPQNLEQPVSRGKSGGSLGRYHGTSAENQRYAQDNNQGMVVKGKATRQGLQIEKKRSTNVKNQATTHPICQAEGRGHIKNKLSDSNQHKRVEILPKSGIGAPNHKRHKSDIVESQRQSFQPLINPAQRMPEEQIDSKGKHKGRKVFTQRKEVKTAQISPNLTQKKALEVDQANRVFLAGDQFYAAQDKGDDTKKVNISIDLLNDELMASDAEASKQNQGGKKDRSQWIEVIRDTNDQSQQQSNMRSLVDQYNQKPQSLSGNVDGRVKQVNEKRKKFMQAYQKKSEVLDKSISGGQQGPSNDFSRKSISRVRDSNGQGAMLIEERNSTDESYMGNEPGMKYKNFAHIAKRKFKSKSQVPSSINTKNSQSSIEQDLSARQYKQQQEHYQGIPADSFQDSKNKVNINLNIPNALQGISEKANGPNQNINTKRSQKDSQKKHAESKTKKGQAYAEIIQGQKNQNSKEVFVPLNSIEMQNFRGIQATPKNKNQDGLKAPMASVQKNNFIPESSASKFAGVDQRIETYESIDNDTTLTAKEKIKKKIVKYIQLAFEEKGQVPLTTVDFYRVGKILGKGAFGKVNLALHHLTAQMVAIKSINKQYFGQDSQRRKVLQEVVILKQTRHKNIVRLFEYFETQKHLLFVIEIAAGGDLLNYVRKRRQLKEDTAKSVFKQLINGLNYCHSKGILHRDIKLDNILLSAEGEVKICDFGVSKVIRRGQIMTEQCGTPAYIAPEILKDKGYEGFGVDIWSSGVVLYAMLYGIVPFRANNMAELQKMIIRADYKLQDCVSKEARDILTGLLEKDPSKRLTTHQILQHPWMLDAKDTVELFTQAEKNYIRTEYTYTDKSRYNRNNDTKTGLNEYDSDAFVDAMLDTNENSILKNADTKSVILAPFNSTKSHIETGSQFLEQVRDLLEDRRVIRFAPRVREVAKQYEVNNNADLDNGVQHDFLEEEAKLKAAADEENKASESQQSGIKMLDQLIKHEESLQMTERGKNRRDDNKKQSDMEPYQNENADVNSTPERACDAAKLTDSEIGEAKNSLAPNAQGGMIEAQETLKVDDSVIEQMLDMGYPREAVVQYLNKNELNNATAAYWLLQMAQQEAQAEAAVGAGEP